MVAVGLDCSDLTSRESLMGGVEIANSLQLPQPGQGHTLPGCSQPMTEPDWLLRVAILAQCELSNGQSLFWETPLVWPSLFQSCILFEALSIQCPSFVLSFHRWHIASQSGSPPTPSPCILYNRGPQTF